MLYKNNKMSTIEYTIYNQWFDEFSSIIKNMKTIYIRTVPEICNLRIKNRERKGENIELDYLKNCHYYHELWLNYNNNNILIIDGNVETNTSQFIENKYFDEVIEKVYKFLNL
jgi:thymidylate kinase